MIVVLFFPGEWTVKQGRRWMRRRGYKRAEVVLDQDTGLMWVEAWIP